MSNNLVKVPPSNIKDITYFHKLCTTSFQCGLFLPYLFICYYYIIMPIAGLCKDNFLALIECRKNTKSYPRRDIKD